MSGANRRSTASANVLRLAGPKLGYSDDVYRALQAQFTEQEQVMLTLLIIAINGWSRIQVGFRAVHPVDERRAA
jgi:alkylhydroperoxidase family enzyme